MTETPPHNINRASKVHFLPPSFRFPPLREGNHERRAYSVPPACRGNLEEGVLVYPHFCELWLSDWYNTDRVVRVYNCPPPAGSPRFARGTAKGAPTRFPLRAGGTLRRGSSTAVFLNSGSTIGKCLCVGFSTCPPPNLPRGRGRSHGSLPARGEGWGGGYVKSHCKDTYKTAPLLLELPAATPCPTRVNSLRSRVNSLRARVNSLRL